MSYDVDLKDAVILAQIATNPERTVDDIAENMPALSKGSITQRLSTMRHHSMVVKQPTTGTAKELMQVWEEYDDIDHEQIEWMVTGKGMEKLREYSDYIQAVARYIDQGANAGIPYRPPTSNDTEEDE